MLPADLARDTLDIVRRIAADVGAQMVEMSATLRRATDKGGVDVVTAADAFSERAVTEALARHFPDHRIAAEEGTQLGPADSPWVWHVDPLDGTANYSRGIPLWAISIGLAHGEEPLVGVIHAPQAGLTVSGAVGLGAWSHDRPLPAATPADEMKRWIVATDWPWDIDQRQRTVRLLAHLAPRIRQYKTFGSAAIDLANLVRGTIDAYAISHIFRWDQAGGTAIARALGYDLRTWSGERWDLSHRDIVACRPGMWEGLEAGLEARGSESRKQ